MAIDNEEGGREGDNVYVFEKVAVFYSKQLTWIINCITIDFNVIAMLLFAVIDGWSKCH